MNLDRLISLVTGLAVLAGVLLGMYVNPAWFWLAAAMGANQVQMAFTGWCPGAMLFRALGVQPGNVFK